MPPPKTVRPKKSASVGSLDRNKKLQEFKKAQGLPTWKELQKDEEKGMMTLVEEKIRRMERFNNINQQLLQTAHGAGWDVTNLLHSIVDLQNNLLEYEEALRQEGKNPMTDDKWLKAREQLVKEMQYIQKQKLDVAEFQHKVQKRKEVHDDDNLFEVE